MALSVNCDTMDDYPKMHPRMHFEDWVNCNSFISLFYPFQVALVNKNWTQGTTKTTWQLIKLYTTKFLAILLGGKVIEGIGRALLVEEDHIIIDFLSDRLITGHV